MKLCLGCKVSKREEDFNYKLKLKNRRQSQCKLCTRLSIQSHYYGNREYYVKKAHRNNLKTREQVREYLWGYLSKHPCIDCEEKDILVLEFDHRGDKFMDIGSMVSGRYALWKIAQEVAKCDVRCANCHRRKTALQQGWHKLNFAPIA